MIWQWGCPDLGVHEAPSVPTDYYANGDILCFQKDDWDQDLNDFVCIFTLTDAKLLSGFVTCLFTLNMVIKITRKVCNGMIFVHYSLCFRFYMSSQNFKLYSLQSFRLSPNLTKSAVRPAGIILSFHGVLDQKLT